SLNHAVSAAGRRFEDSLGQLFEEQWHPVGPINDFVEQIARKCRSSPDEPADQRGAFLTSQPTQSEGCHMALPRPRRLKLGTKGRDQQNREALELFHSDIKQFTRGGVGAVTILKCHHYVL